MRLEWAAHEWGADLAEFIAIGTAVRTRDGASHRTSRGMPFTSDLSGQDFYTLLQAGYMPVGLMMGSCVYHVAHQRHGPVVQDGGQQRRDGRTTPRRSTTRANWRWSACRPRRSNLHAEGIVGTQIQEKIHGWGSHVIEYFAIGTAVIQTRADHNITPPQLVLSLND